MWRARFALPALQLAAVFLPHGLQKCQHLGARAQGMNPLRRRRLRDVLAIARRQVAMAQADDAIAVEGAFPHGRILGPALRIAEQAADQPARRSPIVRSDRQIDIDQRVSRAEPLPRRGDTAVAIDDPSLPAEDVGMEFQIRSVGNFPAILLVRPIAPVAKLDDVERVERQSGDRREPPRQGGLAACGVAKDRDLVHGRIVGCSIDEPGDKQGARFGWDDSTGAPSLHSTLPVELDASFSKARPVLTRGRYLPAGDLPAARSVLTAAAYTNVAAALAVVIAWRDGRAC